ncbi:substrate-binding domain-containing protein [Candidatus Bipolaricaulota bacterium]|nr:substrate-binding domain-containing protein [Candidatus Bipolaricaulota bacterium]
MKRIGRFGVIFTLVLLVGSLVVFATENPLKPFEPTYGERQLKFAMVTICTSVQFWVPVAQGMKDAAAMLGIEAMHMGPPGPDIPAVTDVLETLLAEGIDAVSLFVAVPGSCDVIIEKYIEAGIPILIQNTGDEAAEQYGLAYVGQNNYDAGLIWGRKILELLGPDPAGKRVCFLTETPGQTSLEDRMDAGKTILEPAGVLVDIVDTTTDRGVCYGAVESYYAANPDVAAFCSVDTTGSPVAAVFIEKEGLIGKVFAAGFDLVPEVVEGMQKGSMEFTIDQHPYAAGFLSMMQLYLWKTLGIKPSWIDTGGHVVTPEDIELYNLEELVDKGYR